MKYLFICHLVNALISLALLTCIYIYIYYDEISSVLSGVTSSLLPKCDDKGRCMHRNRSIYVPLVYESLSKV